MSAKKSEATSPSRGSPTKSAFLKTISTVSVGKQNPNEELVFVTEVKENAIQRARREEKEKKEAERRVVEAKKLFDFRRRETARFKDLRQQRRKLVHRIELRPQDQKSALALINVAYELEDYFQVCTVIKRALSTFFELRTYEVYLKLGRCWLRRWKKDGVKVDLQEAFEAYRSALSDPETLVKPLACPYPYFEFAGICARLEKCQMALDILGAVMARWKEDYGMLVLCQYLVAQISFVNGKIEDASELYYQLLLIPSVVEPLVPFIAERKDSISVVSSSVVSILCQTEVACLQHRMGNDALSVRMFSEAFARQNKQGPTLLSDGQLIDIRNGEADFQTWAASPKTYKHLGDLLAHNFFNLAMAAELYGLASEVYCKNISSVANLSKMERSYLCSLVLDRGESLAEMGDHNNAEQCGLYAYSVLPVDAVVTGRAARCCQRKSERNLGIHEHAVGVYKAVDLMSRILRRKVAARRKEARLALNNYATAINSGVRMALVRNRIAGDILEATPAGKIGCRIHSLRGLWKSGKRELKQWVELWNVSCNIIQRGLWRWFIRRRNTKVIRGITSCKRIWRGQRQRRLMREKISLIQDKLEDGSACGRGEYGLYFDTISVYRLTAGITAVTNDQNQARHNSINRTAPQVLSKTPPPAHLRTDSDTSNGEYSLQLKMRNSRRFPKGTVDAGSSWFASVERAAEFRSPELTTELKSNSAPGSIIYASSIVSSTSVAAGNSSALVSIEELDTCVQVAGRTGEDVITLLSVKNTRDDAAYKWIPFAILPEEAVVRLLTCTVLVITSPSFGLQESMRIVYQCMKFTHLWSNIKALHIYGTKLAHGHGLQNLIKLGLNDMHTLTIGHTGVSSSFGQLIGNMLMDMKSTAKTPSLTKLYIENEPRFGIRGTIVLAKALQFNSCLRILSIRRCGLNHKVVSALSILVSLSTHLEILNVNDNNFSYADCRQLMHAVANKGVKGNFRGLYCIGTKPKLKSSDLEVLLNEGLRINVNVISGELDAGGVGFRKELMKEKYMLEVKGIDVEQTKMETLGTYVNEIRRLGTIKDWERVSMEGTKAYKAIYL